MRSILILTLMACGGDKGTTETDDTEDQTLDDNFSDFIYVTEAPGGDLVCFESGYPDNEWTEDSVATGVQNPSTMNGDVIDFESDEPVEEATVDVYFTNAITGTPDSTGISDSAGSFSLDFETCTPYTYRTYTDPALGDTKVTIQANRIEPNEPTLSETFNSVSAATYAVIPSLLGVSPDVDKGTVAGTAYDCNGEEFSGAQIIVRDADGNVPESLVVKYFVDSFPNRNQEWTSEDGLFVAINIPEGEWTLDMYASDGAGGHIFLGQAPVQVYADSINISNISTGYSDGLRFPSSCLDEEIEDTGDPIPVDSDSDGVLYDDDCDDDDDTLGDISLDADCDGSLTTDDCDDDSNTTYPGAADEDSSACMKDADADGFGDSQPSNTSVDAGTDCNDDDAAINPVATEVPSNGIDENCDPSDDAD